MSIEKCTPTEAQVASIWTELLGKAPQSVDDDFFSLGGQSLTFVQFHARTRQLYGIELSVDALFDTGMSVAAVAGEIERCRLAALDDSELDELLAELDGMSDDQVRQLLAQDEE